MSADYTALDGAIKEYVGSNPGHHPIYSTELLTLAAHSLGREKCEGDKKEWRLVYRRLQSLRKDGLVRFVRKPARWVLVSK